MEKDTEYQKIIDTESQYDKDTNLAYFDNLRITVIKWVDEDKWDFIRKLLKHYAQQPSPNRGSLRTILSVLKPIRELDKVKEDFDTAAKKLRENNTNGII